MQKNKLNLKYECSIVYNGYRYRWGNFNVYVSKEPTTEVFDAVNGDNILSIDNHGEQFDGYMENETMLNLIKNIIDYEQRTNG